MVGKHYIVQATSMHTFVYNLQLLFNPDGGAGIIIFLVSGCRSMGLLDTTVGTVPRLTFYVLLQV